jgi:hypothetical protein
VRTLSLLFSVLVFCGSAIAAPAVQNAAELNSDTFNLLNCMSAKNGGDLRWLVAVVQNKAELSAHDKSIALGMGADVATKGCPLGNNADVQLALNIALAGVKYHPGSLNAPTSMDSVAACLAKLAPKESWAFLLDPRTSPADGEPYDKLLEASGGCKEQLKAVEYSIRVEELYSNLNWILRAAPALNKLATASVVSEAK